MGNAIYLRIYLHNDKQVPKGYAWAELFPLFLAIPCQNLAHCIFIMKYWVTSKKIENGVKNKFTEASFELKLKCIMACFFVPYFLASVIGGTIAYMHNVKTVGRAIIYFSLDLPVLVAIPFLGSAFRRLSKIVGALQPVSKR